MIALTVLNKKITPAPLLAIVIALGAGCAKTQHTQTPAPVYTGGSTISSAEYASGAATKPDAQGAPASDHMMATGTGQAPADQTGSGQFVVPLYEEQVQVGTRRVPAGTVHLKKNIKTEDFNQPIQLRQETLTVDRVEPGAGADLAPTGRDAQAQAQPGQQPQQPQAQAQQGAPFTEQDITIQLFKEEPVVEKRIVPKGQIVARKEASTKQHNVQEQVRSEEIQIQKSEDAQNVNVSADLKSSLQDQSQSKQMAQAPQATQDQTGQGSAPGEQQQTTGTGASGAITDLNTLTSGMSNPTALVDRQVQLSHTPVQSVVNNQWFAFGEPGGTQIYVHSTQPAQNLKAGDQANITGTIKSMPGDTSQLGLDQQAAQKLQGQRIYVEASQITPAKPQE
jgi:stress response protein YsnF